MIIKMLITFDFNPDTGAYTPINQELVKEKEPKKVAKTIVEDSVEPIVYLESNKLVFNQSAANLLGIVWEDKIVVKYQKVDGIFFPVIGKSTAFNETAGNKLTKSLTVSCRGKANEELVKYGDKFSLTELKGYENIYVLVGNAERIEEEQIDNIEIKEDDCELDLSIDGNSNKINKTILKF